MRIRAMKEHALRVSARSLLVLLSIAPLCAVAQSISPLPPEAQLVAVSGAPAATQETFTIAAVAAGAVQPDLVVTLTDLQTPAPLASATVLVTQGATLVGKTALTPVTAPTTPAPSATLALPAAVGTYVLSVIGTPNSELGYGTFSVCVAPKSTPTACINSASLVGNITLQSVPASPTVTTLSATLTVATTGVYTFTYQDDQFPVALQTAPSLALFQGSQIIAAPLNASPATLTLTAGTYQLLAIAQADATVQAGLFGITVTGSDGSTLLAKAFPVGTLGAGTTVTNPTTQSLTLNVTDFQFPAALASASAIVTSGGTKLASASVTGGSANFMASTGALQIWSTGSAGASNGAGTGAGSYEVDLTSPTSSLAQAAFGVSGTTSFAYAFVTAEPLTAGSYQATANDFGLTAPLAQLQFAVAQNGKILTSEDVVGTVKFTAAAGPLVLLASATPGTGGNGLFDVNVQTAAATPQLIFDKVQPVSTSGVFTSQAITLGNSGSFDVTLTDLAFPAQFQTLALIGSSAGTVLGTIYSGGTFPITVAPGNLQLTLVAIPASAQQYGLYGLQVTPSAPTVTLTASPTTVTAGAPTTLTWTVTNATACTASGGAFTGSQSATGGTAAVVVAATTTYTLTCTGVGGTGMQSATVTATPKASSGGGGGGQMGAGLLWGLLSLFCVTRMRSRRAI